MTGSREKMSATVLRKNRPIGVRLQTMFEALNAFLDREGDKHFNPDVFDSIYEQWCDSGELMEWQISEVRKLYADWIHQ